MVLLHSFNAFLLIIHLTEIPLRKVNSFDEKLSLRTPIRMVCIR